jgi:hypothetical protein
LTEDAQSRERALLERMTQAFERFAVDANAEPVVRLLGELSFARRFLEEAAAIEDELS